jgi:hypothetical protein
MFTSAADIEIDCRLRSAAQPTADARANGIFQHLFIATRSD